MSFGKRSLAYARRPLVNNADRHVSEPAPDPTKYCPRCNYTLTYFEENGGFWACVKCAYNLPVEQLKKSQEQQQKKEQQQQPKLTGTRNPSSSPTTSQEENNIFIVSQGTRASQKKKDPLDYLRSDDAPYTQRSGDAFVNEVITFPSGDKQVVSSDDLKKEKIRLRGKRIG